MSDLTRAEVERVAALARLGLTSDERGKLQGDLNLSLEQWAHLADVDTSSVPPSAQTIVQAMRNRGRAARRVPVRLRNIARRYRRTLCRD